MRTSLFALLAAITLSGCGATAERDQAAPSSSPSTPSPELPQEGPPPAWIETEQGAFWLGYSTYCWGNMCADYVAPRCGDEKFVPTIVVTPGETVRFHLGFEPREITLTQPLPLMEPGDSVALPSARKTTWRVDREGVVTLFARAAPDQGGADASYVACLKYQALSVAQAVAVGEGDVLVEGPLWAKGDDVRLCDAVAESYPPQCPSGYLEVRGLDLATVKDLKEASGVRWTEHILRLQGVLEGNVLHVEG
jgi:hypothetical protein